ncbi:alpha-ketoacid dehydrogenase subunit beta [Altererythrobacter sp. B11]|uniref:alpha-ketoacid dehydrogenase subunit beta n=1 Tax=Altererythrobacter sp. B11 TaxID=2060312 RepID=UPI000DC6F2B9|nr:transketolase C-terminal domain-containing protein [Altererythrobacter sp. B11]BBC72708.1 alpha-ketoacid dehydrogenase subunit beta [Altererythrobacter sp. B11]
MIDQINASLRAFLAGSDRTYVMGQDILDPYGGAFKATRGLSSEFPDRVLTTPISEAVMVGVATGMALKRKPVCVEIMFGDFLTLCTDQIVNHMSKLPWVYNGQIGVPVVVRAPMGGKRGYGATHSQSLEKHFCGVPGLTVYATSQFSDIAGVYADAFAAGTPHLLIENKITYARALEPRDLAPHEEADLAIVTYGGSVEAAVQAAARLEAEEELAVNIVEITRLSPLDHADLVRRVGPCRKVLVVEEGAPGWGFAAEVALALSSVDGLRLQPLTGPDHPLPSTKGWELALLPEPGSIAAAALRLFP